MIRVGDEVVVRENIEIFIEGEEQFINEKAIVTVIDKFTYPIEIRFRKIKIQQIYKKTGYRRFDFHELEKV